MLQDIVIDTNVLMHADDPRQKLQAVTAKLLDAIRTSQTKLCVDNLASLNSGKNRSQIMAEYLQHLAAQSVGRQFIAYIAGNGRLVERSKSVNGTIGNFINQKVTDKTDRVFVKVALNSDEKVLACHDFNDIPRAARKEIRKALAVRVSDAKEILDLVG